VSTHAEPRSTHSSSRVLPWIGVDEKPTGVSNRNASTVSSFAAEWFARLGPFHRANCLFTLSPQFGRVTPLCDGGQANSTTRRLPSGIAGMPFGRIGLKPLSLHGLPSAVSRTGIDKIGFSGYAGKQKGGSRCGDSAGRASGSVPGTLDNQGRELGS